MSRLVDAQEAQVPSRLELALGDATDLVRLHAGLVELGLGRVLDGIGHVHVADPVADVVGVARPEEHLDPRLHNVGQGVEE